MTGSLGRLRQHAYVFRRSAASPYRFRFSELWAAGRAPAQPLPALEVVSRDEEWMLLEIEGFRFFWPARFSIRCLRRTYHEVFGAPSGNPHAFEAGRARIRPGEWVMDGGACEGFFTAYALSRGANVLAVEPVGALCDALNRTFESEVRRGRVLIRKAVLAASGGTLAVDVDPESVECTRAVANGLESAEAISVDQIVSQGLVPRLDFIKMDIENSEIDALRGSFRVMQTAKPRLAIAVYHELENAAAARRLVRSARPDYSVTLRGVFGLNGCVLRPYMLFAG